MKKIVVGVDGSAPAFGALRWASDLAVRAGADLVAAWAWIGGGVRLDPAAAGPLRDLAERDLRAWCAGVPTLATPDLAMVEGDARHALMAVAADRDAELLVVGPHGRGGPAGVRFGSVTNHLVHHTRTPLAIVPPEAAPAPIRHVVLGVDGSPGSLAAVRFTAGLTSRLGIPVTAVLAQDPLLEWVPEHAEGGWRRHAERQVDTWVAPLSDADVAVKVDIDRDIRPAAALTRVAGRQGGALVVVGGRPLGAVGRARRGRVPLQVVHDAGVAVVVVPATDHPGGAS